MRRNAICIAAPSMASRSPNTIRRAPTASPSRSRSTGNSAREIEIPSDADHALVRAGRQTVALTNLRKPFWPELGISKGDLLRYYAEIAPFLIPHLVDRAMVLKRYPNGAVGKFFFQKRAPLPRPEWIELCSIQHAVA